MANHCYNYASIEGTEQMLDLFEKRLAEATKNNEALFHPTFYQVLGLEAMDGDVYNDFGSRWFDTLWERHSPTTGLLSGDSAWSPVSEFLRKLSEVYSFDIESTYEEGGDNFGGWFDCTNGEVTTDVTTSYYAFRYTEEGEYFMQSLIEDANEGYWESADELDKDLLEAMTEQDKQDLIDAINKI